MFHSHREGESTLVAVKMLKEGHTDTEMIDLVSEMDMMKVQSLLRCLCLCLCISASLSVSLSPCLLVLKCTTFISLRMTC